MDIDGDIISIPALPANIGSAWNWRVWLERVQTVSRDAYWSRPGSLNCTRFDRTPALAGAIVL